MSNQKEFLQRIVEELPTFKFKRVLPYGDNDWQINAFDLPYFLTITTNSIDGTYDIVATHKTLNVPSQINTGVNTEFIYNSLKNFYYMGF